MLEFRDIFTGDKAEFDRFRQLSDYACADYTFGNLYIWKEYYKTKVASDGGAFYISENDGEYCYFPVCGDDELGRALEALGGSPMRYVTLPMLGRLDQLGVKYTAEPMRDSFDYVYAQSDLALLPGKKYHGKRNHISFFESEYPDCSFEVMTPDVIRECESFSDRWCAENPRSIGEHERIALDSAFEHFFTLGFEGGFLRVGGKIVALSAGERYGDTFTVHIEKAADIRGAYPMINREFVVNICSDCALINREEDMGIPGLMKAKSSYHPTKMIEKYAVTICG